MPRAYTNRRGITGMCIHRGPRGESTQLKFGWSTCTILFGEHVPYSGPPGSRRSPRPSPHTHTLPLPVGRPRPPPGAGARTNKPALPTNSRASRLAGKQTCCQTLLRNPSGQGKSALRTSLCIGEIADQPKRIIGGRGACRHAARTSHRFDPMQEAAPALKSMEIW